MSQSSFLFAVLLVAFVLFLAANNRLGAYLGVIWGKGTAAPTPSNPEKNKSFTSSLGIGNIGVQDVGSALEIAGAAGGL